ncbi:hypothetical protein WMY93_032190 [Mugilogobius chulae]|uniref:CNH domain-containing protein n=1 Tax=Mugilogobius chulae TaxID=88201 RepID=A0AAW0MDE8_9GOBI
MGRLYTALVKGFTGANTKRTTSCATNLKQFQGINLVPVLSNFNYIPTMAFEVFTISCVYEKTFEAREKDKFCIQSLEFYHPNLYIGTKQGSIHHLVLSTSVSPSSNAKEIRVKNITSSPVMRIRLVPVYNHLLVLSNRTVVALNVFSLETNQSFKKIQNVSQLELLQRDDSVQMVTCSSQKKTVRVLAVGLDRWEVLKEIPLVHEPLALAVDGTSACVGTSESYLLCDLQTGHRDDLFQHRHSRQQQQQVLVSSVGGGEFLLNGPGGLGLFVTASGVCQRPPLHWSSGVLAACACPPYALCLQVHELLVYSLLDQQCKQSMSVRGGLGLVPTADGALVFTDRGVFSVLSVPLQEQVHRLMEQERLDEALLLLESEHSHTLDLHGELHRTVMCRAGFCHFYQQRFTEATDLFIKGELDPRELLHLFPDLRCFLPGHFHSSMNHQQHHQSQARVLQELWRTEPELRRRYLGFLADFLRAARRSSPELRADVDSALLWLFVQTADSPSLVQLLESPNACELDTCEAVLTRNDRYRCGNVGLLHVERRDSLCWLFLCQILALGLLYQSHGRYEEAVQQTVSTTDPSCPLSCSELLEFTVSRLSQLEDTDTVWKYAPWALHHDQETGVQIFTQRPAQIQLPSEQVLSLLQTHPQARIKYLEFLLHDMKSEEAGHHTHLALAYMSQTLQNQQYSETRRKLQELLWDSKCYDVSAVNEQAKSTSLHTERAILLGRTGDHRGALSLLVQDCPEPAAAEEYCCRLSTDQDLMLHLLHLYLTSEGRSAAALDLLKKYPEVLSGQRVLEVLPEAWSVQLLSGFLLGL